MRPPGMQKAFTWFDSNRLTCHSHLLAAGFQRVVCGMMRWAMVRRRLSCGS